MAKTAPASFTLTYRHKDGHQEPRVFTVTAADEAAAKMLADRSFRARFGPLAVKEHVADLKPDGSPLWRIVDGQKVQGTRYVTMGWRYPRGEDMSQANYELARVERVEL